MFFSSEFNLIHAQVLKMVFTGITNANSMVVSADQSRELPIYFPKILVSFSRITL